MKDRDVFDATTDTLSLDVVDDAVIVVVGGGGAVDIVVAVAIFVAGAGW
jgi:hypothetical protein